MPNVSEGRRAGVVDALAEEVVRAGVTLLDVHRDPDHHRAVLTFVGDERRVADAARQLARAAVRLIDVRGHHGVHPRVGALDVLPFVPLRGSTMAEAVRTAHEVGRSIATELALPVFFYGAAARAPERRELPALRVGGLSGLASRITDARWAPDAGPPRLHPTAGATIVGARRILIAFNAVLATADLEVARRLALGIRDSSGGLAAVRAIAVPLASRGLVQVSMNLLDYRRTPPAVVTERLERSAEAAAVEVLEYELVGCAPADAFDPRLARRITRLRSSQLLDPDLVAVER